MKRIALVGTGVVGSSWALVFARSGFEVVVSDPDPDAGARMSEFIRNSTKDLAAQGVLSAVDLTEIESRIRLASSLEEALDGAEYVQESAPERLEVKKELYRRLDELADETAILASSSSGLPASQFTENLSRRSRCLIAHPINPPHLIPLVEVVPAPWTDNSVVERTTSLMESLGQSPIGLRREINGFVVNRLQSAILGEAFRLVEDGVCTAADVDRAVSAGLGRRWFFMGPFETIDLNAAHGIREYCENLGPMYYGLAREQADPRPWRQDLIAKIEGELRERHPERDLPKRRAWRDRTLARLASREPEE